jgi:hypothetical protein
MNSHKFFFSFPTLCVEMHVTKQDKIVLLTQSAERGKEGQICFHNKGVVELMEKSGPPPAPPPAGDIV